jgi:hypothetical protein
MRIITAQQHISPEATVKGYKKCCTSNEMDGTDYDVLWNSIEEYENVRSECEEDKGIDCEDGDTHTDW